MAYSFEDAVEQILQKNEYYPADAYFFIRAALDATVEKCRKPAENPHLSAEELYFGFCAYALEEYGPLALAVMEQWMLAIYLNQCLLEENCVVSGQQP